MRLRQLTEQRDLITINRTLNPLLWNDTDLKSEVAEKLIEIARAFEEFIGIDLPVVDYTVTGSNANYNWTKYSDLDVHIIISGKITDVARELFSAKKALWSEQRTITVKGLPVECYVQGQDEPHHSTGVYSITSSQWLTKPKKIKPRVNDAAVAAKKQSLVHDIRAALASQDIDKLQTVKEKITKMRKAGLDRAGEWSTENLVFKILRNMELIDQVTDLIRKLEDRALSLEQTHLKI